MPAEGKTVQVNTSWHGGFQIWKNSVDTQRILEAWLLSTHHYFETHVFRWTSPFEIGALQRTLQRLEIKKSQTHLIDMERSFSQPFMTHFRSLDQDTIQQLLLKQNDALIQKNSHNEAFITSSSALKLNISNTIHTYHDVPDNWIIILHVMKDIHDQDFRLELILDLDEGNIGFLLLSYREMLIDYCVRNQINASETERLFQYLEKEQDRKQREMEEFLLKEYTRLFQQRNPFYWETGQPGRLPFPISSNARPRVIVTVFACRRDRLRILMKYLQLGLERHLIDEVHLWDYCRKEEDRLYLLSITNSSQAIFLYSRYTSRRLWVDYYEYYDHHHRLLYPQDILMKCDDDIVFLDIFRLPDFLRVFTSPSSSSSEKINGVVFANIINNGVAAYYQQNLWKILPVDDTILGELEYPPDGFCGSLWESGEKANRLHDYFLSHWQEMLFPQSEFGSPENSSTNGCQYYCPNLVSITTRFSINFFAIQAKNWFKVRDVGNDDEYHISVSTVKSGVMNNYLNSQFIVSHLSFNRQSRKGSGLEIAEKLEKYEELFNEYVHYWEEK